MQVLRHVFKPILDRLSSNTAKVAREEVNETEEEGLGDQQNGFSDADVVTQPGQASTRAAQAHASETYNGNVERESRDARRAARFADYAQRRAQQAASTTSSTAPSKTKSRVAPSALPTAQEIIARGEFAYLRKYFDPQSATNRNQFIRAIDDQRITIPEREILLAAYDALQAQQAARQSATHGLSFSQFYDKNLAKIYLSRGEQGDWRPFHEIRDELVPALDDLANASALIDLSNNPSRLGKQLKDQSGFCSIRVNDKYRIVFFPGSGSFQPTQIHVLKHDKYEAKH